MSKEYWSGGTWIYHVQITNGAGGSGTVSVTVVPGDGNEFDVLYGGIINGDSTNRTLRAEILDESGGNTLGRLARLSAGAGTALSFPATDEQANDNSSGAGARYTVSGSMAFLMTGAAIAASQDLTFGVACRIRGGIPTATEVGQSTPTITVNTEVVE